MNKLTQILMAPEGEESAGGGTETADNSGTAGTQATGAGAAGEGNAAGGGSKYVPYERFQEVNGKYRDLEGKYKQMETMLTQMRGALSPDQGSKKGFKLDYSNPEKSMEEYFNSMLEARFKDLESKGTERETALKRDSAIKWFKEQPDYTQEMEEKAARFITENGLQGLDPEKSIRLAYKFVTLGDGSGYTRQQKEGLRKPGSGARGKEEDVKTQISALDPSDEKYEEKMRELHKRLVGG